MNEKVTVAADRILKPCRPKEIAGLLSELIDNACEIMLAGGTVDVSAHLTEGSAMCAASTALG